MSNIRHAVLLISDTPAVIVKRGQATFSLSSTFTANTKKTESIEPTIPIRKNGDDWQWIGTHTPVITVSIHHVEPRILNTFQFYVYTKEEYELTVRSHEQPTFALQDRNSVLCEHYSIGFTGKIRDYLSENISFPREFTQSSVLNYERIPSFGYNHRETMEFHWQTSQYQEGNVRPNLPLAVSVNLRERRDYRTQSINPIPLHMRTPILEYVRWKSNFNIHNGIDDETLLAALARVIIDIEEGN